MDLEEARRILFTRVQGFDAENAFKIMGYLLLQDWGEQDMFRLALGSDVVLHSLIAKARKELGLNTRTGTQLLGQSLAQSQLELNNQLSSQASTQLHSQVSPLPLKHDPNESLFITEQPKVSINNVNPYHPLLISPLNQQWPVPKTATYEEKSPRLHEHPDENHMSALSSSLDFVGQQYLNAYKDQHGFAYVSSKWPPTSLAEASSGHLNSLIAWKPCLYFARGYCKHGSNCRFLHSAGRDYPTSTSSLIDDNFETNGSDDGFMTPGSLDCLEKDLRELLRGRRTPVSIASLPQLYYEKFGKTLQAEGYLTESQRHGKAGYSLTKLLVRLKGTVTLIDRTHHYQSLLGRPHGQHAVVLTEDAHKFTDLRGNRDDYSAVNPSSRQIYLTFPAESTFTEEDVTIHFRAYGPVQDVRIPYQLKRMFGFVTFMFSETVKTILGEGNPHYICGARVLVKPYKEKGKLGDRKVSERGDLLRHVPGFSLGKHDLSHLQVSRYLEDDQFLKRMEDERILTLERRIAELQLIDTQRQFSEATAVTSANQQPDQSLTPAFHVDDIPLSAEDCFHLQSSTFGYVLDVLEGETKENSSTETSNETVPSVESKISDSSLENSNISEKFADAVEKIKSHHLNSQNSLLNQTYSWGAPTLFARSVF